MSYSDFNVETNCWLPEKRLLWMCPHDRGFTSATSGCGFLSMGRVKQSHTAVCHGDPHFLHQRFFLHRRKGSSTSSSNQLVKYLHIFTQCRHILPRIWRWFQPCFCQSQAKSRNRVFSRGPVNLNRFGLEKGIYGWLMMVVHGWSWLMIIYVNLGRLMWINLGSQVVLACPRMREKLRVFSRRPQWLWNATCKLLHNQSTWASNNHQAWKFMKIHLGRFLSIGRVRKAALSGIVWSPWSLKMSPIQNGSWDVERFSRQRGMSKLQGRR